MFSPLQAPLEGPFMHTLIYFSQEARELGGVFNPVLQMRRPRLMKAKRVLSDTFLARYW